MTKGHTGIYYFSVIRLYIHGYLLLLRKIFFSDENYCSFLGPYNIIIIIIFFGCTVFELGALPETKYENFIYFTIEYKFY